MNLILDQGNTNLKIFFFSKNLILKKYIFPTNNFNLSFINKKEIKKVIYSTVSGSNDYIYNFFNNKDIITFGVFTPLPIKNKYKSQTVGLDRLAGVCGATEIFPNSNILVIDIGSAVTYDFINCKNEFIGGNISPGLRLRYKSLNQYTTNLPLLEPQDVDFMLGTTTNQAVTAGVQKGLLFEIEAYIKKFLQKYNDLKIILTGGDADFFVKKIKNSIFAEPNLIAIGLNRILNYNIEEHN